MENQKITCSNCQAKFEIGLVNFSPSVQRKPPSIFECPNCGKKSYVREPLWLASMKWNGKKITRKFTKQSFIIDLDSREVYRILKEKGVQYFHHANTVRTSKTFLEHKALLSREYIQTKKLFQTPQDSDNKDKEFGINNFIFLDAKDLANYFARPNEYGPVLFILSLDLLLSDYIPTVRITKRNPIYWKESWALNSKYYNDLDEFEKDYLTGNKLRDGGIMFIITTTGGILSLERYLKKIIVDDPFAMESKLRKNIIEYLRPGIRYFIENFNVEARTVKRFLYQYGQMYLLKRKKFRKFFDTIEK